MGLKGQIKEEMKTAMKSGDRDRLKVIRLILAAINQIEIDSRTILEDNDIIKTINKMVKQRRDSI
ncbi:MAG: glutamyl-tRNA amidotransferase, partial [Rickettsiales bacterium]|nr:glutamyl-tRNA amidotransferase [Rickettsiales bacterium]